MNNTNEQSSRIREIEGPFFDAFVLAERRERYRALLAKPVSAQSRKDFLDQIDTKLERDLDPRYASPYDKRDIAALLGSLHALGAPENTWVTSYHAEYDGLCSKMADVLPRVYDIGAIVIFHCVPGKLAFVIVETSRYLCHKVQSKR